jgi:phytoene synthase
MDATDSPLASFEAKWTAVHPEFALALKFIAAGSRPMHSAFACLVFELEHAAFAIREAEPAMIKLQWWGEEFASAARGETRHPLTRVLAADPAFATIAPARWHEIVIGALAQRDREPAADNAGLFDDYARFYSPLGAIESVLFGVDGTSSSAAMVAARALREIAALPRALQEGRLPLPLDLLARYRLTRGDLVEPSAQRSDAVREWLRRFVDELDVLAVAGRRGGNGCGLSFGIVHMATIAADRQRASRAARARDPLVAMDSALHGLSFAATWATWRAVRGARV